MQRRSDSDSCQKYDEYDVLHELDSVRPLLPKLHMAVCRAADDELCYRRRHEMSYDVPTKEDVDTAIVAAADTATYA